MSLVITVVCSYSCSDVHLLSWPRAQLNAMWCSFCRLVNGQFRRGEKPYEELHGLCTMLTVWDVRLSKKNQFYHLQKQHIFDKKKYITYKCEVMILNMSSWWYWTCHLNDTGHVVKIKWHPWPSSVWYTHIPCDMISLSTNRGSFWIVRIQFIGLNVWHTQQGNMWLFHVYCLGCNICFTVLWQNSALEEALS